MAKRSWKTTGVAVVGCALLAVTATAGSLFGDDGKSRAVKRVRAADAWMARADEACDGGNPDQALTLYRRAAELYEEAGAVSPDLAEGQPRFRLAYCRTQIARLSGQDVTDATPAAEGASSVPPAAPVEAIAPPAAAPADSPPPAAAPVVSTPPVVATPAPAAPATPPPEAVVATTTAAAADATAALAEARALLAGDRLDDAARLLVERLKAEPQHRGAHLLLALVRCRQRRFDDARMVLADLPADENDLPRLLIQSLVEYGAGSPYNAMLALDKAIRLDPAHPSAYLNMAWLRLSMGAGAGNRAEAEAYYREAVKRGARRDYQLEKRLGLE